MSFLEWLKLENSKDPDNILPPELDFEKAIYFLKDYLFRRRLVCILLRFCKTNYYRYSL